MTTLTNDDAGDTTALLTALSSTVLSVKDYGAKGDGATDDTAAIQAVLSLPLLTSETTAGRSVVIYFPRGTYKLTAALVPPNGTRTIFWGEGANGAYAPSVLKQTNANADFITFASSDVMSVDSLVFWGAGSGTGAGNGVTFGTSNHATYTADSKVTNCWFTQIPNVGVRMYAASGIHIENNTFEISAYGIYSGASDHASYNIISGCRFFGNGVGIHLGSDASYNDITGNVFDANLGSADDSHGAIIIEDNALTENRGNLIAANVFRNNRNDIILTGASSLAGHTGITSTQITGNISDFAMRRFVYNNAAAGTIIVNNHVRDAGQETHNTYSAIELAGAADNVTVRGNSNLSQVGTPTVSYGLLVGGSATNTVVGVNNFSGTSGAMSLAGTFGNETIGSPLVLSNSLSGTSSTMSSFVDASGGDLRVKTGSIQGFTLVVTNTTGTIQHRIQANAAVASAGNFQSKIVGASATLNNTPSVDNVTDFVAGGGINAAATQQFLFKTTNAQVEGDMIGLAVVEYNDTATARLVILRAASVNVNGVTQTWPLISLLDAATGASVGWNATTIPAGKFIQVRVLAFVK